MQMLLLAALLQADLGAAIARTRAETSYEVTYAGEGTHAGVAFKRWGVGAWRAPGVLVLQGEAVGGKKEYIVRAGVLHSCGEHDPSFDEKPCPICNGVRKPTSAPRVWVYEGETLGWMKSDQAAQAAAAQGAQNPHDLLGLLGAFSGQGKAVPGGYRIALQGQDAVRLATGLQRGAWTPEGTKLTVDAGLDPQGRIATIKAEGTLAGVEGAVTVTVDFKLARFGEAKIPAQLGPGKPGPTEAAVRAAIDAELKR